MAIDKRLFRLHRDKLDPILVRSILQEINDQESLRLLDKILSSDRFQQYYPIFMEKVYHNPNFQSILMDIFKRSGNKKSSKDIKNEVSKGKKTNNFARPSKSNNKGVIIIRGIPIPRRIFNALTDRAQAELKDKLVESSKDAAFAAVAGIIADFNNRFGKGNDGGDPPDPPDPPFDWESWDRGFERYRVKDGNNSFNLTPDLTNDNNITYTMAKGSKPNRFIVSHNPKPASISIGSNVNPQFYNVDYMDPIDGFCSPLHLSTCYMQIPGTAAQDLYEYFTKNIAFDIQVKAQNNVGFNLNITNVFTAENLLKCINVTLKALQFYYYYTSVMTYHSDFTNKNSGMIHIHNNITIQDKSDLTVLARRLKDTPFPPNLMKLVRYMAGNFYSGMHNGSTMYKIVPGTITKDGVFNGSQLNNVYTELCDPTLSECFSLIRRAIPQWRIGDLADVPTSPLYDSDFLTIFANLPFQTVTSTGAIEDFPELASETTDLQYNCFSDNLDGVAYSLTSPYITSIGAYVPNLIYPLASINATGNLDTRVSFSTDGVDQSFINSRSAQFLCTSRAETYISSATGATAVPTVRHLPGASRCSGVNANTILDTSRDTLDWLMSLPSIARGKTTQRFKGSN